jgi:hypothetical protein
MIKIDTIIPFCTYDIKYIDRAIEGVRDISNNIYVTYCSHLFNGEEENIDLINTVIEKNNDCIFMKFNFSKYRDIKWHVNYARWIATEKSDCDYILYIDADEVFDRYIIKNWFDSRKEFADITTFANYWYFRSEKYQAKAYEDSPMMVKRSIIDESTSFHGLERGYYKYVDNNHTKEISVMGNDGFPMCHHYSWALDKNEMLAKVKNWSHKTDKNWEVLVEQEFSREFNGTDFIHGYEYNILQ